MEYLSEAFETVTEFLKSYWFELITLYLLYIIFGCAAAILERAQLITTYLADAEIHREHHSNLSDIDDRLSQIESAIDRLSERDTVEFD